MTAAMDRRAFLSVAPVALIPSVAVALPSPDLPALVEAVMGGVLPYRGGYVGVSSDDLRALCEAAGVPWGEHWAMRYA